MGRKQFATLPLRLDECQLRVMLITTRRKRRWSFPKGSLMRNTAPHRTAAIEAYEEAGLIGIIAKPALGSFKHCKRKGDRKRRGFPGHASEETAMVASGGLTSRRAGGTTRTSTFREQRTSSVTLPINARSSPDRP